MRYIIMALIISAVFIVVLFAVMYAVFRRIFVNPSKSNGKEPEPNELMGDDFPETCRMIDEGKAYLLTRAHEDVSIITDDGYRLYGEFFINPVYTENTILCVHGYNSSGHGDFGAIANSILDNGYNCFILNHRHHSKSEGKYIGFGVLDSRDLIKWIEKINEKYPNGKIILYGISMGAATVMQASDKYLTDNVVGIIEDCGYTSAWDEFNFVIKNSFHLPSFPILNILELYTKLFIGFNLRESDSRKTIAKTKLPVLFIHGDADAFVPCYMMKECYSACNSKKEMYLYSGAAHAQSYYKHKDEYEKNLYAFIENCLK